MLESLLPLLLAVSVFTTPLIFGVLWIGGTDRRDETLTVGVVMELVSSLAWTASLILTAILGLALAYDNQADDRSLGATTLSLTGTTSRGAVVSSAAACLVFAIAAIVASRMVRGPRNLLAERTKQWTVLLIAVPLFALSAAQVLTGAVNTFFPEKEDRLTDETSDFGTADPFGRGDGSFQLIAGGVPLTATALALLIAGRALGILNRDDDSSFEEDDPDGATTEAREPPDIELDLGL